MKMQKGEIMRLAPCELDNLAKGNCGYYAYAFSLALYYHHRFQKAQESKDGNLQHFQTELDEVLNLLEIPKVNQELFVRVIRDKMFKTKNPKKDPDLISIQEAFEPRLRKAAATSIYEEFVGTPDRSSILPVVIYKLRHYFNKHSQVLKVHIAEDDSERYDRAEIFKVPAIDKAIDTCARFIVGIFADMKLELCDEPFRTETTDSQFKAKAKEILKANRNALLIEYCKHVNTSPKWATEEILGSLHHYVQGAKLIYVAEDERYFEYQARKIPLQIFRNGSCIVPLDDPRQSALKKSVLSNEVMILNNKGNAHWTSVFFAPSRAPVPRAEYKARGSKRKPAPERTGASAPKTKVAVRRIPQKIDDIYLNYLINLYTKIAALYDKITDLENRNETEAEVALTAVAKKITGFCDSVFKINGHTTHPNLRTLQSNQPKIILNKLDEISKQPKKHLIYREFAKHISENSEIETMASLVNTMTQDQMVILSKHRDWGLPLVGSILLTLTLIGAFVGAAQYFSNKNRYLFWKFTPDSAALAQETIDTFASAPAA